MSNLSLATGMLEVGIELSVITQSLNKRIERDSQSLISNELSVHYLSPLLFWVRAFLASRQRREVLWFQGFFDPLLLLISVFQRRAVLIVSPRGQISHRFAVSRKKKLFINLFTWISTRRGLKLLFHCTSWDELKQVKEFCPGSHYVVVHNPVRLDLADIGIVSKHDAGPGPVKLGYVGRLDPRKGLDQLLLDLKYLSREQDIRFFICGSQDSQYARDFLVSAEKTLSWRFEYHGTIVGRDLAKFYNSIDFLVLPSDEENFGNVVLESLYMKTPVLAKPILDWVSNNDIRSVFFYSSVDELAELIRCGAAYYDPDYLKIKEEFDRKKCAVRFLAALGAIGE